MTTPPDPSATEITAQGTYLKPQPANSAGEPVQELLHQIPALQKQEEEAILLFDEADALFGKRSEVKDSHDPLRQSGNLAGS